jgi:rhodanese-related sulfurtransferase
MLYSRAIVRLGGHRDIDPAVLAESRGDARVIDVREPAEYTGELGHIAGSELVPIGVVPQAAKSWDRQREIVLVCRSGARSTRAAATLVSMGFERVMSMAGGMIAWRAAGLPTE